MGVPTVSLTPEQFRQISTTERASGIGAILAQHWSDLAAVAPQTDLCWLALEKVRSPGNFGSPIRTAEAVGAAGFISMYPLYHCLRIPSCFLPHLSCIFPLTNLV
ncbi:MAG: hypothetical protein AAGG51_27760 [Cyanobacteria bacterium P01_G01_bin.54]